MVSSHDGNQPALRVGAAERDAAVVRLREAYAQERLTAEEFDERLEFALAARTQGELDGLVADLPAQRPQSSSLPAPRGPRVPARWRRRAVGLVVVLGLGTLTLPPLSPLDAFAVMGSRTLRVPPGESGVTVAALMGGVEVIVPDGTVVDSGGLPIMGGIDCRACGTPTAPGAPVVRVDAYPIMGGVEIRTVSQPDDDMDHDDEDRSRR